MLIKQITIFVMVAAVAVLAARSNGQPESDLPGSANYSADQIRITDVSIDDDGNVAITFTPMAETLYYCPGANREIVEQEIELTFVRAGVKEKPAVDFMATKRAGSFERVIRVSSDGKPIFVRFGKQRKLIFDPQAATHEPPLFPISMGGKQGFMNQKGQVVIKANFEKVYPFTEGMAAVQVDGLWGFINTSGETVIRPQFIMAGMFSDGRARIRKEQFTDPWGYINKEGRVVIRPQFDCAGEFRSGVARVGTVTESSKLLSRFADIGIECDYRFIDLSGRTVPRPAPEHFASGKPDELILFQQDDRFGYVDAAGEVRIPPQFVAASGFSEGLACVRINDLYGYINKAGEFVIPPRFKYPNDFSEGLAGVPLDGGKWGFIDRSGKTVVEPRFSWIYNGFRHGIVEVAFNGKAGYVDTKGEWVWKPTN